MEDQIMAIVTRHPFLPVAVAPFAWRRSRPASSAATWTPRVDIIDQEATYLLRGDLPGMAQDAIDIQFENGVLTLRGQRQDASEAPNAYYRRERAYGAFVRQFNLGKDIAVDQIAATYTNGVLEIQLPKTTEAQMTRIPVKAA